MQQREKLWSYSMPNDQNFEQHWKNDFRMSRDTFRDIVRVVEPALDRRDIQFRRQSLSISVLQLRYEDFRKANLSALLQKQLQSVSQQLFSLLENVVSKCCL